MTIPLMPPSMSFAAASCAATERGHKPMPMKSNTERTRIEQDVFINKLGDVITVQSADNFNHINAI